MDRLFGPLLLHYIDSSAMLHKFLAAVIVEEWACKYTELSDSRFSGCRLLDVSTLAQDLASKILTWLQGKPPPAYQEMYFALSRIHADCVSLLQMFATDCKLPTTSIPNLGQEVDISGSNPKAFGIETAQKAVGPLFTSLRNSLGRTRKKELTVIMDKRNNVLANIERYDELKSQHDVRVSSAFASAFVALRSTPDKVSPVVKGIMNGIKVDLVLFTLSFLAQNLCFGAV